MMAFLIGKLAFHSHILKGMRHVFKAPQEERVGITQFISQGEQIPATTKYLLSDFIVNQIDTANQLVIVNSKPGTILPQNKPEFSYEFSEELKKQCLEVLGQEATDELEKVYERLDVGEKVTWEHVILNVSNSRDDRIRMHTFVREKLTNIESTTLEGSKIRLKFRKNLKKIDPNTKHKYTYFNLFKNGVDTNGALFKLSKITGISQKIMSTAGLKDKRGFTTQRVALYNTDLGSIMKFYQFAEKNRQIWIDSISEGHQTNIGVGDLAGNQFGLVLRLIYPEDQHLVTSRVETLREIGMVNYFGMQRFGSFATKTYELGMMVIKKQWKELVEELALGDSGNFQINQYKREIFESKHYYKAEKGLANKYKIQKLIFRALNKYGLNYSNVFESLPRSIKTLYIHSLQSYIWNKIVSRRLKEHGLKLVINDLVGTFKNIVPKEAEKEKEKEKEKEEEDIQLAEDSLEEEDVEVETQLVNQENINQFTIHDLVAPLYGPSAQIEPSAILHEYIQDELKALGLKNEDFVANAKLLCFKGQFRRVIVRPGQVECNILKYRHNRDQLQSPFYTHGEKAIFEEGEKRAIQIALQLPKSCYATMAIREILHLPSEFNVQIDLNKIYEQTEQPTSELKEVQNEKNKEVQIEKNKEEQ